MAGFGGQATGSSVKSAKSPTSLSMSTRPIQERRLRLLGDLRSKQERLKDFQKPRRHGRLTPARPAELQIRHARRSLFGKNQAYSPWEERIVWKAHNLQIL